MLNIAIAAKAAAPKVADDPLAKFETPELPWVLPLVPPVEDGVTLLWVVLNPEGEVETRGEPEGDDTGNADNEDVVLLGAGTLDTGLEAPTEEEAGTEPDGEDDGVDAGGVIGGAAPLLIVAKGVHCEEDGMGCAAGVLGCPWRKVDPSYTPMGWALSALQFSKAPGA